MLQRWSFLGTLVAAVLSLGLFTVGTASAIGICKCDSKQGFQNACLPVCREANEKTSFFRPAVYFGDDPTVSNDPTPLNGTSLKFLYLAHPSRQKMERFRQFLEKHRLKAEAEFQAFRKAYLRAHVGPEEFIEAEKMRDEALVNYQHGMRAYLTTPSPR